MGTSIDHPGRSAHRRRAPRALLAAALGAVALAVVAPAGPAAAGTIVTTSGTILTAAITGDANAYATCSAGKAAVITGGSVLTGSPAISCSALTKLVITGDGAMQLVSTSQLSAAAYPALTATSIGLGDGADTVFLSQVADTVNAGPGADSLYVEPRGPADGIVDAGDGTDRAYIEGTEAADSITASSSGANLSTTMTGGATANRSVLKVEGLVIEGYGGGDTLSAAGVTAGSAISPVSIYGGDGDDNLIGSNAKPNQLYGEAGTNHLTGGAAIDALWSRGASDTLTGGFGIDFLYDDDGRFGGRIIAPSGSGDEDYWNGYQFRGDAVLRIRPRPGGVADVTAALSRPGRQALPEGVTTVAISTKYSGDKDDHTLGDFVPLADARTSFGGDGNDLLDVTVPTGTWSIVGTPATTGTLNLSDYQPVDLVGTIPFVHAPWADANQSFAHRVVRDLQYRFPAAPEREDIRSRLAAATTTRAAVITSLTGTDAYRGVRVDGAFSLVLRRPVDPAGRTYWIGRLASGLGIRTLRANLYGSNEFFTKYGYGTNGGWVDAAYREVLGRAPDASGRAYWVSLIEGGTPRGSVAERFLSTSEARAAVVTDQFLRFVGRVPTSTESTTWTSTLSAANGEESLIAFLAASNTYFTRD